MTLASHHHPRPTPVTRLSDWRQGVTYQLYLRSFADGTGDGVGDLPGALERLDYIQSLGVDSVWVSPWYVSPMADGGYDVADFRDIDPLFGTLKDADLFIDGCHRRGLRVIVDVVVNHCSSEHPWFRRALESHPGSPEREMFYFRDGRGASGDEPPTDWISVFGGPAWTRIRERDGQWGQWYLHLFDSAQPDLNWHNPVIVNAFEDIFRFWFDRGVDGLRLDAVPAIGKDADFRDAGCDPTVQFAPETDSPTPYWDSGHVHDIVAGWRQLADSYSPPKYLVGEINVAHTDSLARYIRPGELSSVFAMSLAKLPWSAEAFRSKVSHHLENAPSSGSWFTWVTSSHDEVRTVTRLGRMAGGDVNLEVGTERSRAILLMLGALPGGACLYQGDELGLPQVTDIPRELLEDPIVARTGDPSKGRDGCRVALPWSESGVSLGFSSVAPRVRQPRQWGEISVEAQGARPDSFLNFTRRVLDARRDFVEGPFQALTWLDWGEDVVAFTRGRLLCVVNFSEETLPCPDGYQVLLSSGSNEGHDIAPNCGAWLWATSDGEA